MALRHVSAGVHQLLTLITTLVAREKLVVFVEHPEKHLHPHSKRALQNILSEATKTNHVVIVTHDPSFVDPKAPQGLRRIWWTSEQGTQATSPQASFGPKQLKDIDTALRQVGNREMVFARAVLVVEDESLFEFLRAVAPKLGLDIDGNGVSIVVTEGHGVHKDFNAMLDALAIPYLNLRDLPWKDEKRYPPERYMALGHEFEKFMDGQGHRELRLELSSRYGSSHRRGAAALAQRLEAEQIPEIFGEFHARAIELANAQHSIQTPPAS